MDDLVRWLGEQLDEDERIAKVATPGPWRQHDTHLGQYGHTATVLSGERNETDLRAWLPSMSQESWDEARNVWADAVHIAAWDPARVLREIDAKREQIAWCVEVIGDRDLSRYGELGALKDDPDALAVTLAVETLRLIAAPFSVRPGYRAEWVPSE
jgi:hypothetical protein